MRRLPLVIFRIALAAQIESVATGSEFGLENFSYRVWRSFDGLPSDRVTALTQTRDGYLWIGTSEGLARFDGAQFKVFSRASVPAFEQDSVISLFPSADGTLWIGTEGGGLIRLRKSEFTRFGPAEGLSHGMIRSLAEDARRCLWVATDNGVFRREGERFVRVDGRGGVPSIWGSSVVADAGGGVWVGGRGVTVLEHQKTARYLIKGDAAHNTIKSLVLLADGTAWAGAVAGLYRLKDGEFRRHSLSLPVHSQTVFAILKDRRSNLWVGFYSGGLACLTPNGIRYFRAPKQLPDNKVFCLFEDSEGNIWIGTQNGLVRYSRNVVNVITSSDGLSDDNVVTISETSRGKLWLVTADGRLHSMHGGGIYPYRIPEFPDTRFRNVFADRDHNLLFGTDGRGLIRISGSGVKQYTTRDGLTNDFIRAIYQDRSGVIWIGTDSGLNRWDGKQFRAFHTSHGLAYGSVRAIHEDRKGNLWIGTERGLSLLRNGQFVTDSVLAQIGREKVWSIHEEPDDSLWFGTRGGGVLWLHGGKLRRFTTAHGMPSDSICQILSAGAGAAWVSTPRGIYRLRLPNPRLSNLLPVCDGAIVGEADGLQSDQMNGGEQPAGCSTTSGEIWFPSVKGAVCIRPGTVLPDQKPRVVIEDLLVDGLRLERASSAAVPAGSRNLEIHYSAPSLRSPERVRFRYRLDGADESWIQAGTRRAAHYGDLRAGHYVFRVVASSVGSESSSEVSLPIYWKPRIYETAWFYIGCSVVSLAMVCAAIRWRLALAQQRYKAVIAERNRLAREMHDTLIQGCVGVSTILEAASSIGRQSPELVGDLLDRARGEIRRTLDEARQAVWEWRSASGEQQGFIAAIRVLIEQTLSNAAVAPNLQVEGHAPLFDLRTQQNLLLIVREALRNVVTHARADSVSVRIACDDKQVSVVVEDDGCGFDPAEAVANNQHFGLTTMRERVEELGGLFRLTSAPGRGTSVKASLPCPRVQQRDKQA